MTTTEPKVFAPGYDKDENDWYLFPRDSTHRKEMYGPNYDDARKHPAKMNWYVCEEIINYISKPGEVIVDPFGGIGTTMQAILTGRHVRLIEIEEVYAQTAESIHDYWNLMGWAKGTAFIIQQDNRQVLPMACDHIITSPPYGNDLFKDDHFLDESIAEQVEQYGSDPRNIGRLNPFLYVQNMNKLYKKMVDSVRPGGYIAITHRDRRKGDQRVLYAKSIMQTLQGYGMKLDAWHKWKAPMGIQGRVNQANGVDVIQDEDILIFRKPE